MADDFNAIDLTTVYDDTITTRPFDLTDNSEYQAPKYISGADLSKMGRISSEWKDPQFNIPSATKQFMGRDLTKVEEFEESVATGAIDTVRNLVPNIKNAVAQTVLELRDAPQEHRIELIKTLREQYPEIETTDFIKQISPLVEKPYSKQALDVLPYNPKIIDVLEGREYPDVTWAKDTIANATKVVQDREISRALTAARRGIEQDALTNRFGEIVGNMLPIMAAGYATGGVASALGASGATAGALATGAAATATFADMSGQYAYDTAREYLEKTGDSDFRNFTPKDAKGLSAWGYGAIGTAIEFGFGGVEPLVSQAFTKAGIEQGIMRATGKIALGEAWEEFLQEWEEFLTRKMDGTSNRTWGQALKDSLKAALWGGLVGGTLGGITYRVNRRNAANILTKMGIDYKDALKVADVALSDLESNIKENADTAVSIKTKTGQPYNDLRLAVDDAIKVVEEQGRRVVRPEEREEFIDGIVENWGTWALNQANLLNMTISDFLSDIQPRYENGEIRMYQQGYMSPQYTYERLQDIEKRIADIEAGIATQAEQEKYNEYKKLAGQLKKINAVRVAQEKAKAKKAQQQAVKTIENTPKTAVAEVEVAETPVVPQGEVAPMPTQPEQPAQALTAQPQVQTVAQVQKQRVQDAKKVERGAYNISGFFNALPETERAKYQAGETPDAALQERFDNALLSWIINDPQLYNQLVVDGDPRGERIVNALRPVAQQFVEFNLTAPTEYRIDDSFRIALGNYITLYTNPNISEFYRSNDMIGQGGFDSNALLYAMRETNTPSGISDFLQAYIDGVVRNQQDTEYGKQARSEILAETIDKSFQSKKGTDQYNSLFTQLQRGAVEPLAPLEDAQVPNEYFDLADENARLDEIYPEYTGETITVDGKERPVYNSEGKRINKSAEALTNFWRWFGNSKVVDEQGRPLVLYHGSKINNLEVLDSSLGDSETYGSSQGGTYMSSNYSVAMTYMRKDARAKKIKEIPENNVVLLQYGSNLYEIDSKTGNFTGRIFNRDGWYSRQYKLSDETGTPDLSWYKKPTELVVLDENLKSIAGARDYQFNGENYIEQAKQLISDLDSTETGKVYPVYLKMKKPLVLDFEGNNFNGDQYDGMENIIRAIKKKRLKEFDYSFEYELPIQALESYAKTHNYDGLIVKNVYDNADAKSLPSVENIGDDYVVFEPTQIKSVDNSGTYDIQDPNIYYDTDVSEYQNDYNEGNINTYVYKIPQTSDEIYPAYEGETITVDGKKRTVFNSDGVRIAKSKEALTNFWKWFGDSKVVDEQGRPLVVYHSTKADFDTFKILYHKTDEGTSGEGFYFTPSKEYSKRYGDKTLSLYLSVQNMLEIQPTTDEEYIEITKGNFKPSDKNKDLAEILVAKYRDTLNDAQKQLLDWDMQDNMYDSAISRVLFGNKNAKQILKEQGYDGVKYVGKKYDLTEYTVYDSTQIKSVDNRGTYDLQDPNIYYDRSPSQWRGMFNMIRGAIAISGSVKPSTIQHELAHFWLDNMWNRYKSGKYTDAWLSNFQSIAKWLGINLDADYISTPAHEQFARGYEAFISGRTIAGVPGLKPAFDRYDRFVRRVYKTARDIRYRDATGHPTNPVFTKEAFDAFDRLLQVPDGVAVANNAEITPKTKEEKDENAKTIKKSIQETRTKIAEAQDQRAKENPSDVPILRTTGYAKDTDGKVKKSKNGYYIVSTQEGQEKKALDLIKSNPQLAESIIWGGANQTDIDRGVLARAYANFIKDTDPAKAELIREYEITTISRSAAKTLSHIPRNDLYRSAARQILAQKTRNLAQANYGLRAGMVEQLEKDLENRIALAWEAVKNAPMAQKQAVAVQQIREIASDFSTVDELPETLADADFTQVNERTFTEIAGAQIRRMLGLTLTQNESDQLDVLVEQIENSMEGDSWERQHYLTEETARLLRQYSEFIAGYSPQTMWDKATKLYYPASMLMNLPTHFKNVITNFFQQVASSLSVAGGIAQIEIPLEQLTKDAKYDFNLYLKTGFMPSVMTDITSPQQILGEKRMVLANPNWFDNIAEKSLNVLSVEDAVFKSISFYRELAIIASKQAKKEGLTGKALKARALELYREGRALRGQTEWGIETRAQASEIAKVDTFVGTNGWTRLARSARNTLNQITIRGRSANIGNILSPFIVVGTNIVRGGFNLTGLPIASGIAIDIFHPQTRINDTKVSELIDLDILSERQAKALFKGGKINQRVARTLIAEGQITEEELKGLTYTERFGGATVRGLSETGFAWLFIIGLMSLLDDDDWMPDYDEATAAEKARAKEQGIQFGSIRIGNTWVSTDLFGYLKYPIHWAMNTRRFGVKSLPQSALNTAAELPVISDVMDLWNQNKYNKTTSDYLRTFGNTIIDKLNGFIPGVVNNAKRILQKSGKLPTLKLKKKGEALETKQTREFDTEDIILYTLFGQAISTED